MIDIRTKPFLFSCIAVLCVGLSLKAQDKNEFTPSVVPFNNGWQFEKNADTVIRTSLFTHGATVNSWQQVSLPHTANIEPVIKVKQQWQGISFYRKFFRLATSDGGKHIAIRIDAAMSKTDVYLNGKYLMSHEGGYLPFEINLTDKAKIGQENCLLIRLNNKDNLNIPPGKLIKDLDFNFYSGLYRNAWLIKKEKLFLTDDVAVMEVNGGGVLLHYDHISAANARLKVKIDLKNDGNYNRDARIRTLLYSPSGKLLSTQLSEVTVMKKETHGSIAETLEILNPDLWSPAHPVLYRLVLRVESKGKLIDSISLKTGVRKISFKPDGFYLNDKRYSLRGTNRHQEYPYIGYALSDNAQYRDAYKIKQAGFDFVRCSHYPPSPAFLNACDELGIFVMDSTPGWQFFGKEAFQQNSLKNITDMVHRDRNHPSIILWEAALNETPMQRSYMEKANAIVHTELPYDDTYTCGWMDEVYDVFIPARQHAKAPDYWKKYAVHKPIFIAEYGDWEYYAQNAGFNQTAYEGLTAEEKTSRQLRGDGQKRMLQQALNFQEAHNDNLNGNIAGDANWLMFDYKRGYAPDIESSGVMDIFRLPKFSYYFYQSQSSVSESKPMLFIANYWAGGDDKKVKVYSNCDEVELILNGKSLGRQKPDVGMTSNNLTHPPFTFKVDYQPGKLLAKGYRNGKTVVLTQRVTPGKPYRMLIAVDYSGKKLVSAHNDAVFVYVSVVDKNGTVLPASNPAIRLTVAGAGELIGDKISKAEAGIASFLLRGKVKKGKIRLTATSASLKNGILTLVPS